MDKLVTLEYRTDNGRLRYVLEGKAAVDRWPDESDRTLESGNVTILGKVLSDFHEALKNLRTRLQKQRAWKGKEEHVWIFLQQFHEAGCTVWEAILGRAPFNWLDDLNAMLTSHLGNEWWEQDEPVPGDFFEIQMKGPTAALLPLELLPFGMPKTRIFGGPEDLRAMVSTFGGFVARIRYETPYPGRHINPPSPARRALLDIRSLSAPGTDDMAEKLKQLSRDKGSVVYGRYPSNDAFTTPDAIARTFAIVEATPIEGVPPDLIHVYSHGYTWPDPARTLVLEFIYQGGKPVILDGTHISHARSDAEKAQSSGPIVFLNSCHSLGHIGCEWTSSALKLVQTGTRAVLGVRDEIPASVAVVTSACVLEAMELGWSLGTAMFKARWQLITTDKNPLGLLYAVFGDIDATRSSVIIESTRKQ